MIGYSSYFLIYFFILISINTASVPLLNWIEHIKNDENRALKELYAMYRDECVQWLMSKQNLQLEDAKEIFQTAVVILYDNVITGKLEELNSHIKSYLIGICKNKAYELYRQQKRVSYPEVFPTIQAYVMEEDDKHVLEEEVQQMNQALTGLGDPCRSIIQLFYYKKMSMDDITALMGYKNSDTTKNLKYKCIKRLQKALHLHKEKTIGSNR